MKLPHISRIISRISHTIVVNFNLSKVISNINFAKFVFSFFIFSIFLYFALTKIHFYPKPSQLNFVDLNDEIASSSLQRDYLTSELNKTLEVVENRPDYRQAWIRLSSIYMELGQWDYAKTARSRAETLNSI